MAKSIRRRLQFWYATVIVVVVGGFAVGMYTEVSLARHRELDADLVGAANYIDSTLRQWPPHELDSDIPFPKPKGNGPPKGPPPFDRLRENLVPPGWPAATNPNTRRYLIIFHPDGRILESINFNGERYPKSARSFDSSPQYYNLPGIREVTLRGPFRTGIVVGTSIDPIRRDLQTFAWKLAIAGSALVGIGLLGGWWISSRMLKPLERISKKASKITATKLSERIDTENLETELTPLADALNRTFSRLDDAFAQLTRFTADASHELRTPLAILKSNAELALSRERSPDEYRATLRECIAAVERMTCIVEGLLTLARADSGTTALKRDQVRLDLLCEAIVRELKRHAREKKIKLVCESIEVTVLGDETTLARAIQNLVENGIRYNREGGVVRVRAIEKDSKAIVTVSDTGYGISEMDLPRIFDRFYRSDEARDRARGGTGLGLAICKSMVEAHGGTIQVESRLGEGTTFRLEFPSHLTQSDKSKGMT